MTTAISTPSVTVHNHAATTAPSRRDRREYFRAYQAEWARSNRLQWLAENGPCVRCGSSDALEVDHKDPGQKVTHRVWSWSKPRREAELAKCQVLCRTCHHAKTAADIASRRPHGTRRSYQAGCRCAPCRLANINHNRAYNGKPLAALDEISGVPAVSLRRLA